MLVSVSGRHQLLPLTWNTESRQWRQGHPFAAASGPGPLAFGLDESRVYAGLRGSKELLTLRVTAGGPADLPKLDALARTGLESDPCYLRVDASGRWLLAAYYGAGLVTVHALDAAGVPSAQPAVRVDTGPKAHCIGLNPLGPHVWVPQVGVENAVREFQLDSETGELHEVRIWKAGVDALVGPEGPRHLVTHESTRSAFVSNEHSSSVTRFRYGPEGLLEKLETLSTLPSPSGLANTCAQLHIEPGGRFLYVSNRGHDSLAIFHIDAATGALTAAGWQETEPVPRAFSPALDGRHLFCSGLASGCLTAYEICQETGRLHFRSRLRVGEDPMWVLPCPVQ